MGDRYMVIAHNPIVKKAISKEKLTKRGLVSLSGYYLKVAVVSFELNRRIPNGTYGGVRG